MTVSSTTSKVSYSGNGTTTAFAVSFYFLADSQLTVTLRAADGSESTKVLGVDYTVTGAGVSTGGTVTMTVAPASGTTLVISRNVPITQETDLQPNDRLPAETLEQSIDKLTMIDQQLQEEVNRAIKFPVSDSSALNSTLVSAANRADKYLKFDNNGEPFATVVPPPESFASGDEVQYATAGQTVFTLTAMTYVPGINNLVVFVDGVNQYRGIAYQETSSNTVTFTEGLHVGAEVKFTTVRAISNTTADAATTTYLPAGSGAVQTNVQTKLREQISVEDYGAVGDGVTDDTAAIQLAINALTAGDTLVFQNSYKVVSSLLITNKSRIRLTGKGRVFLSGAASGAFIFQLVGTCDDVEIDGLTLQGDNNAAYTQTAIGCFSGQTISNTRFHDLNISNINVGISHNANLSGSWTGGSCYNNVLDNILGTVSGSGYGIQMAKATRIHVYNNTINNCGRHSIYQAAGVNVSVIIEGNVITNHRSTVGDGSFRAAAVIARSSDVTFTGNKFYNCYDCCLEISHVTSDSANCTNILVEGNSFTNRGNAVHTILIGEQAVPTSYSTSFVNIFNNTFDDDLAVTALLPPNIYITNGTNITIENNRFVRRNVTSSLSSCILYGVNAYLNTSSELNNLVVRNNTATSDANTGSNGFITVCSTAATGTNYYWIKDNYAQNWPKLIAWDATATNPNSFLKFRIVLTPPYDIPSIPANSGFAAAFTVEGCKRTSAVRGRPQYSLVSSGTMYSFYAKDDVDNAVAMQVVNVTTGAIDPPSQSFLIDIEDVEPYYG